MIYWSVSRTKLNKYKRTWGLWKRWPLTFQYNRMIVTCIIWLMWMTYYMDFCPKVWMKCGWCECSPSDRVSHCPRQDVCVMVCVHVGIVLRCGFLFQAASNSQLSFTQHKTIIYIFVYFDIFLACERRLCLARVDIGSSIYAHSLLRGEETPW